MSHKCIDDRYVGARLIIKCHYDETLVEWAGSAWIEGAINVDVNMSFQQIQKLGVCTNHGSHHCLGLLRMWPDGRTIEKWPVLVSHHFVVRSVLDGAESVPKTQFGATLPHKLKNLMFLQSMPHSIICSICPAHKLFPNLAWQHSEAGCAQFLLCAHFHFLGDFRIGLHHSSWLLVFFITVIIVLWTGILLLVA